MVVSFWLSPPGLCVYRERMKALPIAITCGDPAGVGPEIIRKWCEEHPELRAEACVIGPAAWLGTLPAGPSVAVGDPQWSAVPGKPTEEGARVALAALLESARGCREGRYRAVVTGPVSKEWMDRIEWGFPGQTEFFADQWKGEPTMAFAGGKMRVVLATWHIPLMEVAKALDEACLTRAVERADWLVRKLGIESPRIAVCGLNPHAGEKGLLGKEELELINPCLERLRERYPGVSEALPSDTVFWRHLQGDFDVVVALYHDQGLGPLKTVDFEESVNISLGLPFVRTSPDHGTAFALAGKNKASAVSLGNAIAMARRLSE